ncbi:MAG TPA: serine hydrolase domain-containing protein [Terracidiphilus sp.]|nr:serine hydrolase domain-containing protein [Terracidiphilus sp.]
MQVLRIAVLNAGLLLLPAAGAQAPQPTPQQPTTTPAAQPAEAKTAPGVPPEAHPLDQADLGAFFDGVFQLQLERGDIAGASVLAMQNGNVLFKKGFGFAEWKSKKAVDPDTTIFRLASISKLFTWISVMQLAEQGKLDLDSDVNRYLDFPIRPAFDKPVTLRNLMTHTGGFEEVLDDIIVLDPKKQPTLRDDLMKNQPRRIFPPGLIPAYSNYGVGVASYIVQRLSGEPFEQYVQDHIFTPLGMTHSSFYQPIQKPLADLVSEGYRSSTLKPPVGFEMLNPVGAGGLSSTATDMGRFGQALLNGGELEGRRILKPETLALMWTPQFRASDQLPPICMGFYQDWRNGLRWIGHEGDLIAFHSLFFVEPTQKIVLFASYNSAGGGSQPRPEILNFFSDRYFPGAPKTEFLKTPAKDLKAIEGSYETTRRADSTKLRLMTAFGQARVRVDKDGVLHLGEFKDLRGHPIKWKPIGKDLWLNEDGQERVFGIRDGSGRVVRIAFDFPGVQLQRVPWYEDSWFVGCAAGSSLGILVLVVLATLIRLGRRIFLRQRPRLMPRPGTMWLTLGPRIAAFCWVALLGTLLVFFTVQGDDLLPPTPDWFKWFVLMNWATAIALFFSVFAVIAGIRIWWRGQVRRITRIKFSLVGLSCLILSWFSIVWHVIGPAHRI